MMVQTRKELLQSAALEAGACIRDFFGRDLNIKKKGELDLVTQADEAAEQVIVDAIAAHFPGDGILAEEGSSREGKTGFHWIIDPLDGTTNFAHGFPHFSVSIGVAQNGRVRHGIVYDPVKQELFEAHEGEGARLNGKAIRVAGKTELGESLSVTGFSYDRRLRLPELLGRTERMLQHCQGFRRLGSAALDLAYIACGRFDIFLEDRLNPWDIAAGQLLVLEAGGAVCGFDGGPVDLAAGHILACNPSLAPKALAMLVGPYPSSRG